MKYFTRLLSSLMLLSLAACGGGASSGTPNPLPSLTPSPAPSSGPGAGSVLVEVITPKRVAAAGTSLPQLTELVATITQYNGGTTLPSGVNPTTVATLPSGSLCTAGALCTFTMPAPSGSLTVTITAYAGSHAVSTLTKSFVSSGAAAQTLPVTLDGIVQNVSFTIPTLTFGAVSSQSLGTLITDPSGAVLAATDATPFANPLTFTDHDTSGSTTLQSGSTIGASVPDNNAATQVLLRYNGGGYTSFSITWSSNGSPAIAVP